MEPKSWLWFACPSNDCPINNLSHTWAEITPKRPFPSRGEDKCSFPEALQKNFGQCQGRAGNSTDPTGQQSSAPRPPQPCPHTTLSQGQGQMDGSSPPAAGPGCSSPRVTCEPSLSPLTSPSSGDKEIKPCPKAHAKGSASPELPLTGLLLPKTFLSRNRSHEAERKPQSSSRALQEPFTSQPQGVHSWAVNKLLFTTQSRARRTVSLRNGGRKISAVAGSQISSDSTKQFLETWAGATHGSSHIPPKS